MSWEQSLEDTRSIHCGPLLQGHKELDEKAAAANQLPAYPIPLEAQIAAHVVLCAAADSRRALDKGAQHTRPRD